MPNVLPFPCVDQADAYHGWMKERGCRWRRVVSHADVWVTWSRLLHYLAGLEVQHCEATVLPAGRLP